MRTWKEFEGDVTIRGSGAVSNSLAAWLREKLAEIPSGAIEVETNLGGLDEAGSPSPDFDWVRAVTEEFLRLQVHVTYEVARNREEAIAPYEVRMRWGDSMRRAWVQVVGPGR